MNIDVSVLPNIIKNNGSIVSCSADSGSVQAKLWKLNGVNWYRWNYYRTYTNGDTKVLGQCSSKFRNPAGLQKVGPIYLTLPQTRVQYD